MYLKEIQIENFKSFKGKMNVPFLEGYTAITGPNGCGKSNISDAVLFVLGPRSSRAIRAGRLTDLIFNGGKDGKPASFCKVSLLFDNSDGILPISGNSVKLTRLVKRSKTQKDGYLSYFYVNDSKSTMGEFENILSHARVSADGYNMVQQGDITNIVEMGNVQRRTILDDIAGITRFDKDIDSAQKERENVDDNMERIDIILDEIRKQLAQLESERGHAMKYRELKEKLDLARAQIEYKKKESVENEIQGLEEQIGKRDDEIAKVRIKKEELAKETERVDKELQKYEDEFAEKSSSESSELKVKIDNLRVEIARSRDSAESSKVRISELKENNKFQDQDLKKVGKEISGLEEKKAGSEKTRAEVKKKLDSASKELKTLESKLAKTDTSASVQKEMVKIKKEHDSLLKEVRSLTLENDRTEDKINRLGEDITSLEESRKKFEFEIKDTEWRFKQLRSDNKSSEKALKDVRTEYFSKKKIEENMAKQALELETAIRSLTREYNNLKAESDAAKSVKRGYTAAVSHILEARDKGNIKGIHGTIAELSSVGSKFETSINTAAGPRMQAVVVDSDAVAEKCISYLKKQKIGRATFLPLNKMLSARPRGKAVLAVKESLGFAIDAVKFDEKYRNAFWYVFGDTILVDEITNARKLMGGIRLVTLDGELIEASGAMIGGIKETKMLKLGGGDKNALEDVTKKLRKATDEADKLSTELSSLRLELIELEKKVKEVGTSGGSSLGMQESLDVKKKELKGSFKKIEADITAKKKELDIAKNALKDFEKKLAEVSKKVDELKDLRESKEREMMKLTPIALSNELRDLQSKVGEYNGKKVELDANIGSIGTQLSMYLERMNEINSQINKIQQKIKENDKNIKDKSKIATKLETDLKAMLRVEESMGKELIEIRDKRDVAYKKKTGLEAEIEKMNHTIEAKGDFLRGLKMEFENAGTRLKEIEEAVKTLKLDDTKKLPSMETLKKIIRSSEVSIEALGSVNMLALDTYDEQKERHADLKEEVKRLRDHRKKLIKLVDELKEKKKTGLLKVYKGINEKFKDVYADLSEGGDAELLLENPDEPFEGGLMIKARPKGKKVHRMEALSGGEKGLVSMSFIFAIQRYQPSPFYMLDEVDQNLDAINAKNIAQMIKRNSGHAQFLQISLREVTLKEADNLIGVTMQKEGISDLVMKVDLGNIKGNDSQNDKQDGIK